KGYPSTLGRKASGPLLIAGCRMASTNRCDRWGSSGLALATDSRDGRVVSRERAKKREGYGRHAAAILVESDRSAAEAGHRPRQRRRGVALVSLSRRAAADDGHDPRLGRALPDLRLEHVLADGRLYARADAGGGGARRRGARHHSDGRAGGRGGRD